MTWDSITMKPLSKLLSVLCSSQSIMTSGAQHELLEKLLFRRQVCVDNLQNTSICMSRHP